MRFCERFGVCWCVNVWGMRIVMVNVGFLRGYGFGWEVMWFDDVLGMVM